ncbi:MAG: sulfoxide reductase heme-binding subunit YedZ, partial [Anaerolineales bacterium]|nr:sulfoxide reductase heme-binding subunit YedZ [Anaerolineales bacterium]
MQAWLRRRGLTLVVSLAALAPLACIAWRYAQGRFVVDPVRQITTITGKTALIMLLLTLAVTPARRILG